LKEAVSSFFYAEVESSWFTQNIGSNPPYSRRSYLEITMQVHRSRLTQHNYFEFNQFLIFVLSSSSSSSTVD
jgi:hypothetical protein